jgi:hypothetical protein
MFVRQNKTKSWLYHMQPVKESTTAYTSDSQNMKLFLDSGKLKSEIVHNYRLALALIKFPSRLHDEYFLIVIGRQMEEKLAGRERG